MFLIYRIGTICNRAGKNDKNRSVSVFYRFSNPSFRSFFYLSVFSTFCFLNKIVAIFAVSVSPLYFANKTKIPRPLQNCYLTLQKNYREIQQQNFYNQIYRALGNAEELSTDEGSSGEDSDNEELATKLESMLKGQGKARKGPVTELQKRRAEMEDEEQDRMDLQRMIHGEVTKTGTIVSKGAKEAAAKNVQNMAADKLFDPNMSAVTGQGPRKLKIYRTYKNADGSESVSSTH